MGETRKIGIFNNKGGVAKTTSVINLAYSLQKQGKKILVVDCDTQENCFMFFMANRSTDNILPTEYEYISHTTWERYVTISEKEKTGFDFILLDLPPTMSDKVKVIIRHCDVIYVPTVLGEFEIAGLRKVTDEIHRQGVKLGGVFITMYQQQNDAELIEKLRKLLQKRLLNTVIPYSKTVRESQKAGLPIEAYFRERGVPQTKRAWTIVNAYERLAMEIMEDKRNGKNDV